MIIDCSRDFYIRRLVNLSKRLIREQGQEGKIWVTIEEDLDAALGYSIVLVDITTHKKLKVIPERLNAYYDRTNNQDISDLSLT